MLFLPQNMWIERTTFRTAYPLPGILRWFVVTSTDTVRRGLGAAGGMLQPCQELRLGMGSVSCLCHAPWAAGTVCGLCSSVRGGCLASIQGVSGAMAVEM